MYLYNILNLFLKGHSTLQKFPMTAQGLRRLEEELRRLKDKERPEIIHAIAEARSLLSISSPLAKALIGKEKGTTISVPAPGGDRSYEILDVIYA